jgi:hypothetical protein
MRRSHSCSFPFVAGLSLVLLLPPTLSAQVPELARGEPIQGVLEAEDGTLLEGHRYDAYVFDGAAGEVVILSLVSNDFDAYLVLDHRSGILTERVSTNDDGGFGTDAQLALALPAGGEYVVVVRGLSADALGRYTLELRTEEHVDPTVAAIEPGQVLVGELGEDDDFTADVAYYELFTFDANAGDRVGATLRSSQFDTQVEVGHWDGATFSSIGENDDGFDDGTTDSRLVRTLPTTGRYAIRATSYYPRQEGQFTVELEALPPAEASPLVDIRAGDVISGELTAEDAELDDGSYFDLYRYQGAAGERVTVALQSEDFDAYLALGAPSGDDGFDELATDDDGGSGTDSQATVTVPAGGILLIRANSLGAREEGAYTISLRSGGM